MKALITSDWHLRADRPRCRLDEDWIKTQENQLSDIANIANEHNIPVCIIGDIFDKSFVSERIKIVFLKFVSQVHNSVYILAGNHELPYHAWENVNSSSFGVIWNSGKVKSLSEIGMAAHFNEEPEGIILSGLVFLHCLVFPSTKDMPPNVKAITAAELLDDYPSHQWIFTGDYHHAFHYEKDGRHVVNPGCINRQTADMMDYQPTVYLVDTDTAEVIPIEIKDNTQMITDEYLRIEENRESRIAAFVEGVRSSGNISLDFLSNLGSEILANPDMSKNTTHQIQSLIEECK